MVITAGSKTGPERAAARHALMALYELFSHPAERGYRAGLCSKAALFLLLATALTYIPPLLVAFRSHGEPLPGRCATQLPAVRCARAGLPDLPTALPPSLPLRVLAEAEQLRRAADCGLPAPSAARGLAGTRAWRISRLEHVPRLQQAARGSSACPARFGAWFPPTGTGRGWGWRKGSERPRPQGAQLGVANAWSVVCTQAQWPEHTFNFLGSKSCFIRLLQAVYNPEKVSHCCQLVLPDSAQKPVALSFLAPVISVGLA